MLRYQVFLSYGVVLSAVWWWFVSRIDQLALTELGRGLILFAPFLGVVMLGLYLLFRLVLGVASYHDCPDAAAEIDAQIKEAKIELKRRKIISD